MRKRLIEICANSVASCLEAQAGGASRVELCAGIPEGGTTPSLGEIKTARALLSIDLNVIIRPRGGDFCYSAIEVETMIVDIEMCKELGVSGVVIGALLPDGSLDLHTMHRLIETAKPELSVTFHRAFDACCDAALALEQIIELGCDRILTSGQQPSADRGAEMIGRLVRQAADRIVIMPGCGVNARNIEILEATGACEFHLSARRSIESPMTFRRPELLMGSEGISEFERQVTARDLVSQIVFQGV